jgi:hypothetical protein
MRIGQALISRADSMGRRNTAGGVGMCDAQFMSVHYLNFFDLSHSYTIFTHTRMYSSTSPSIS